MKKLNMISLIGITSLALLLGACNGQAVKPTPKPSFACTQPNSKNLNEAVAHAKGTLSYEKCTGMFFEIYDRLLMIAEGDPKVGNKKVFRDFLIWSKNEGILSNKQMKQMYNQHFTTTFVTLPTKYKTCYYCSFSQSGMGEEKLLSNMDKELSDKQRGMMSIMNNKNEYLQASSIANSVKLRIEAACHACNSDDM